MRVMVILALLVGLLAWFGWSRADDGGASRLPPDEFPTDGSPGSVRSSNGLTSGSASGPGAAAGDGSGLSAGAAGSLSGGLSEGLPTLADLLKHVDRPALEALERRLKAAVEQSPHDGVLRSDLCETARLLGHFDLAAEQGERAISLLPNVSRTHHLYAKALGEQMRSGGLFTAIRLVGSYKEQMAEAIALDSQNFRARAEQIAFLLFMPSIGGGDKDRAAQLADQLEGDDSRWGLLVQALVLAENDDEAGAVAVCEGALDLFPGDQKIAVTLAGLLEDVGRNDEADEQFAAVLEGVRGEAYYLALYQRARMHIRAGQRLRESITALEAFVAARPYGEFLSPVEGAYYRMGSAWQKLGETAQARAAYGQALELDPDFERAEEALDALGDS